MSGINREYTLKYAVDHVDAAAHLDELRRKLWALEQQSKETAQAVQQVGQQTTQAGQQIGSLGGAAADATEKTFDLTKALQNTATGLFIFEQLLTVGEAIGDVFNKARERADELAEGVTELRDKLREIANLKGHNGPDDAVAAEVLRLGMDAGLSPDDADQFLKGYEGTAPAGRAKGNIQPEQGKSIEQTENEIKKVGARFASRTGLSPREAGDMVALLSQYGPVHSGEDAAGKLAAIAYGANEGRGDLTPLFHTIAQTAGNIVDEGGKINDLGELAAIVGVSSLANSPSTAGVRVQQSVLELQRFQKQRGESLTELGIKPDDSFMVALHKIAPQISGPGGTQWLMNHGFQNRDGNKGLIQLAQNVDLIDQRIAREKALQQTGADEMNRDADFLNNNPDGQNRRAEATSAAQEFLSGRRGEDVVIARKNARQRLINDHQIDQTSSLWDQVHDLGGIVPKLGLPGHYEVRIEQEIERFAHQKAIKSGMSEADWNQQYGHGTDFNGKTGLLGTDWRVDSGKFHQLDTWLRQHGDQEGLVGGDREQATVAGKLDTLIDLKRQQIQKAQQPPPGPGGPAAAAPPRPAAKKPAVPKRNP